MVANTDGSIQDMDFRPPEMVAHYLLSSSRRLFEVVSGTTLLCQAPRGLASPAKASGRSFFSQLVLSLIDWAEHRAHHEALGQEDIQVCQLLQDLSIQREDEMKSLSLEKRAFVHLSWFGCLQDAFEGVGGRQDREGERESLMRLEIGESPRIEQSLISVQVQANVNLVCRFSTARLLASLRVRAVAKTSLHRAFHDARCRRPWADLNYQGCKNGQPDVVNQGIYSFIELAEGARAIML